MPKRSSKVRPKEKPKGSPSSQAKAERSSKNPAAVALGRLGGLKGGKARSQKLSAEQRREIAQRAARIRWNKAGK